MRKSPASSRAARPRSTARRPLPRVCVILGKRYKITYCARPYGVNPNDPDEAVAACINYERGIIRCHDGGREWRDILNDLMHEILHAIADELAGPLAKEEHHDDLNRYAVAIVDTLHRNGWVK